MYQASKCEELKLWAKNATELPESLGRLTGLKKLYLWGCGRLERLSDSMSQLVALKELSLYCCYSLVGTVELRSGVKVEGKPRGLTITYKSEDGKQVRFDLGTDSQANMNALIDALGGSDQASKCEELLLRTDNATELPESLGRLTGLKKLSLNYCDSLESLPDSMSQLVALQELELNRCYSLVGTVELRSGVKVYYKPDGLTVTSEEEIARKAAARKVLCVVLPIFIAAVAWWLVN